MAASGVIRTLRRAAGFCGSIAPTRVSLGRARPLVQNTVGACLRPARTVFEARAGVNSRPLYSAPRMYNVTLLTTPTPPRRFEDVRMSQVGVCLRGSDTSKVYFSTVVK